MPVYPGAPQLSTGPTSETGKAKSSLNAVKTGLTGRTVLLHSDDAADYQRHVAAYQKEFAPIGQRECDLVQSIADTVWRLARIPALEFAIFAQGRAQFAEEFKDHDAALQPGLIELKIFTTYEKQLRNLHIQESRLSRRREKEISELRDLHELRRGEATAVTRVQPTGFEFSTPSFTPYPFIHASTEPRAQQAECGAAGTGSAVLSAMQAPTTHAS